jgi:hypothetical protein
VNPVELGQGQNFADAEVFGVWKNQKGGTGRHLSEKAERIAVAADLVAAVAKDDVVVVGRRDWAAGWRKMLYPGKVRQQMRLGKVCECPPSAASEVVGLLMSRVSQFHWVASSRLLWSLMQSMVYHLLDPRLRRYQMP